MSDPAQQGGKPPEDEIVVRYSEKFVREQRRKSIWGGLAFIAAGLYFTVDSIGARSTTGMVTMGPRSGHVQIPWWMAAAMGAFVVGLGVLLLWKPGPQPSEP